MTKPRTKYPGVTVPGVAMVLGVLLKRDFELLRSRTFQCHVCDDGSRSFQPLGKTLYETHTYRLAQIS